jgi:hypothetical protein
MDEAVHAVATSLHDVLVWQVLFSAQERLPWQVPPEQHVAPTVLHACVHLLATHTRPVLHMLLGLHGPLSVPAAAVPQMPLVHCTPAVVHGVEPVQHAAPVAPQPVEQILLVPQVRPAWQVVVVVQHALPEVPHAEQMLLRHSNPEEHGEVVLQAAPWPPPLADLPQVPFTHARPEQQSDALLHDELMPAQHWPDVHA